MVTLHWYNETFIADKAVRVDDSIILYDENNTELYRIINISIRDWAYISLDGEWTDASEIPTKEDQLLAEINSLKQENEQQQADIDFCLMLLEE